MAGCKLWQTAGNADSAADQSDSELSVRIPFSTREPDVFRAEIIISTFINGEKVVRKYVVAKKGGKRLITFDSALSKLQTADNKILIIDHNRKVFFEAGAETTAEDNFEMNRFLSTKWMNEKGGATFENLGTENKRTKYLVKPDNSESAEILIFFDEKLQIPARQEFYSVTGERKILTSAVEIKDFKTRAEDKLFEVPDGYKKLKGSD